MSDKTWTYIGIFALGWLTHNFMVQQQVIGSIPFLNGRNPWD